MKAFLLGALCLVWTASVCAQAPENVLIHRYDGMGYQPCEPSIAVSPADPNVVVAGSILDNVYRSVDGGATWTRDQLVSPHGVFGDPCVIGSPTGDFYYLHLSDPSGKGWADKGLLDRIVCQRSRDGGRKWSRGSYMGLNGAKDQDKEWADVDLDGGQIAACWTQFDAYGSTADADSSVILCAASNRRARRWSRPVRVSAVAGDCRDGDATVEGAVPAFGPDGALNVVWARDEQLWFNRSENGGRKWGAHEMPVANIDGGWDRVVPGIGRANGMPVTEVDCSNGPHRGRIYVNWTDLRNGVGDSDVWLCHSDDAGATWSAPVRVNGDDTATDQFFTWMAVDDVTGGVHVVYYDRSGATSGMDVATEVVVASSFDGGTTWEHLTVSESPFVPGKASFFGDYNNISAHAGVVRPIWTREDQGVLSIWTALMSFER